MFLGNATYNKCAKNSKPYFSWNSWKFLIFKLKNKSLSKNIIHLYFSMQNQFNQTITIFVIKPNNLIKLYKR